MPKFVQIYVEIERARLTRRLGNIQEEDGQISEAADTLQEVAVVRGVFVRLPQFPCSQVPLCIASYCVDGRSAPSRHDSRAMQKCALSGHRRPDAWLMGGHLCEVPRKVFFVAAPAYLVTGVYIIYAYASHIRLYAY